MFVRCLVDCFHREFRVSTQIMVRVTASQNAKSFPPAEGNAPFNGLSGIFFFFFVIQNIYVDSNPANGGDAKAHLVKHTIKKRHKYPKIEDFNIIRKSYRKDTLKRRVTESLSIKDIRL